jgi:hypothetical protein
MWKRVAGYGALLAAGTLALQWLDYQRLVRMHSGDVYLFLVAAATRGRCARSSARWNRRGSIRRAVRKPAWAKSGPYTMPGERVCPRATRRMLRGSCLPTNSRSIKTRSRRPTKPGSVLP